MKYLLPLLVFPFSALATSPTAPVDLTETQQNALPNTPIFQGSQTFQLEISGAPTTLWDVDLFTHIQHTATGELRIVLTSPAGTRSVMTSHEAS